MSEHDFDFLQGHWRVRHRKLTRRLAGATEWIEFPGTTDCWPVVGGRANVDDNLLHDPTGEYRALTLRRWDPRTELWSIWWLDGRTMALEPPVHGRFAAGVGTFVGDDTFDGRPIRVRFTWSAVKSRSAEWSQAFSADGGATWEDNWTMRFERR